MSAPFTLFITDRTTGERRLIETVPLWDADGEDNATEFMWTEGNFSCDCNRGQFFAESAGESDPEQECGDTRYGLTIVDADGRAVYDEETSAVETLATQRPRDVPDAS